MKWIGVLVAGVVAVAAVVFFILLPPLADDRMNVVLDHSPYRVSNEARALHASIPVADLHADTLLWMRDPLKRQSRGHTDLPRFQEGGYRLQVFGSVTKTPSNLNYDENDAGMKTMRARTILRCSPSPSAGR